VRTLADVDKPTSVLDRLHTCHGCAKNHHHTSFNTMPSTSTTFLVSAPTVQCQLVASTQSIFAVTRIKAQLPVHAPQALLLFWSHKKTHTPHLLHFPGPQLCFSQNPSGLDANLHVPFGDIRHVQTPAPTAQRCSQTPPRKDTICVGLRSLADTRKTSLNSANWACRVVITTSSQTCCMLSPGTSCLETLYSTSRPGPLCSCRLSSTSSLWSNGRYMLLPPSTTLRKAGSMTLSVHFFEQFQSRVAAIGFFMLGNIVYTMTPLTRVPNSIIACRHGALTAMFGWALSDIVRNNKPSTTGPWIQGVPVHCKP
jgi:hypothetical protein